MCRRPECRRPRTRRRAPVLRCPRARLPYTLIAEAGFIFPSSLRLPFPSHLAVLLFNCHQSCHHVPLSTWAAAAPSVVAVALGHPHPLHAALPQASAAAESHWSTQATTPATKDAPIADHLRPRPNPSIPSPSFPSPPRCSSTREQGISPACMGWHRWASPLSCRRRGAARPVCLLSRFPSNRSAATPSCPRRRCPTVPRCPSPGTDRPPSPLPWRHGREPPVFTMGHQPNWLLGPASWGPLWIVSFPYFNSVSFVNSNRVQIF
jgi:hypothetical protein